MLDISVQHCGVLMERYGKWTVLSRHRGSGRHYMVVAVCDCGTRREMRSDTMKSGRSKSCGCEKSKNMSASRTVHGGRDNHKREYSSWKNMRERCLSPTSRKFMRYGGRGITICERWDSFPNFLSDMGPRPFGKTLGRIDNDGAYCPDNCRWETPRQQAQNTSSNVKMAYNGRELTLSEWARVSGVKVGTVQKRYHAGWLPEEILGYKEREK